MSKLHVLGLGLAAGALTFAVNTGSAQAQSKCTGVSNVVTSFWSQFGERVKAKGCKSAEECMANTQRKEEILRELVAWWNQQAQGSWATIGPRALGLKGESHDGNVVLGTSRLFHHRETPAVEADWVSICVTKQGGGGAKISLSSYNGTTNNCTSAEPVSFDKGDRDNTKKGTVLSSGVRGNSIYVKVDAEGTQKFDYKFTAQAGTGRPPSAGSCR